MEALSIILVIFVSLILLMLTGMPVAFCFIIINVTGAFILYGFPYGMEQLVHGMYSSLASLALSPIPFFIIMGEIIFLSGLGNEVIRIVDQWLGRLPGRISLMAILSGAIMSALTGVSIATVAMIGNVLVPEMEKNRYHKSMIFGPILTAGGLANLIPPSGMAVLVAAIGEISVGKLLIGIIFPGLILAFLCVVYITVVCAIKPSLAPKYETSKVSLSQKVSKTLKVFLPFTVIVFSVIGFIVLGIATPVEAAACGAIASFLVAVSQKRMSWFVFKGSITSTLKMVGTIFFIIAGAKSFSHILAFTGATQNITELLVTIDIHPIAIVILMQLVMLLLGCFMDATAIVLLTIPLFMPAVSGLGLNPIWFGALVVLNIEMGLITPPLGLALYTMKAVAPPQYTILDIIQSTIPFLGLQALTAAIIMIFPGIVTWVC